MAEISWHPALAGETRRKTEKTNLSLQHRKKPLDQLILAIHVKTQGDISLGDELADVKLLTPVLADKPITH